MLRLIALALLAAPVPATAQKVLASDMDWSYLPRLDHVSNNHLDNLAVAGIADVIARGDCSLPGQYEDKIDLSIPFAVELSPDGQLDQLVVRKLGCPEVEGILAGALIEMVKGGDYRPEESNPAGWYRGHFNFAYSAPARTY